jgi:hypothetical protein
LKGLKVALSIFNPKKLNEYNGLKLERLATPTGEEALSGALRPVGYGRMKSLPERYLTTA